MLSLRLTIKSFFKIQHMLIGENTLYVHYELNTYDITLSVNAAVICPSIFESETNQNLHWISWWESF